MTLTNNRPVSTTTPADLRIGEMIDRLIKGGLPVRFTAYDGSSAGPPGATIGLHLRNERGLRYLLTAPGDLGLARAYVTGDLEVTGVHPGDPYAAISLMKEHTHFRMPPVGDALRMIRGLGLAQLKPPPPPPQEHLPRWRRVVEGMRHSMTRDAEAIHHHYDVSNRFYELVLGPSMTYTCACYPSADATLEEAQELQVRPRRPQARSPARPATARRRLRLGRHGAPRRPRVRRAGARRDAVRAAGAVGAGGDQA